MVELATLQAVSYIIGSLGVFLAAIYYVFNMRATLQLRREANKTQQQQLETRQAQMFMGIYERSLSKEWTRALIKFREAKWDTFEEYNKLRDTDDEFREATAMLSQFFEGVGVLVREGLLPIRMLALLMTTYTRLYWERYQPMVEAARGVNRGRRWLSESEYLYGELMEYIEEHPELAT